MPDPETTPDILDGEEQEGLARLVSYLEDRVPEPYRIPLLHYLLPRVLSARAAAYRTSETTPDRGAARARPSLTGAALDPTDVGPLLRRRGHVLVKALAMLHLAESQLGVRWLSPAEIAALASGIAQPHVIYRSNLSNALRAEQDLVASRRRGRGFEYHLTRVGRARLEREITLAHAEG